MLDNVSAKKKSKFMINDLKVVFFLFYFTS